MTELRQKFERHLTLLRLSPKTNAAYMNAVKLLAAYHRQSPDKLTNEQIQEEVNQILNACQNFKHYTLLLTV